MAIGSSIIPSISAWSVTRSSCCSYSHVSIAFRRKDGRRALRLVFCSMPGRLSFLLLSSSVRSMYSRTRVRISLSKISRSNVAILEPQLGHVNSWSSRCVCIHSSQNDVLQQGVLTASRISFVHSGQAREGSFGCRSRISDSVRTFERVFCFSQAALRILEFVQYKMTKLRHTCQVGQ